MDSVSLLYESGQFSRCITELNQFSTHSVFEELTKANNVMACRFQEKASGTFEEFSSLVSKLSSITHDKRFSYLTLTAACNSVYSAIDVLYQRDSDRAIILACQAVEAVLCQQKISNLCMDLDLYEDRFAALTRQLINRKQLELNNTSLVLYLCALLSILDPGKEAIIILMKEILSDFGNMPPRDCSAEHRSNSSCFLLFPAGLQKTSQEPCLICDVSIVFLSTIHCIKSSWSAVAELQEVQHPKLRKLWKFLEDYARFHHRLSSSDNALIVPKIRMEDGDDEKNSHLKFARCLLAAAELASTGKHSLALKFLRYLLFSIFLCT